LEQLGFSPPPASAGGSPVESVMERLAGAAAGRLFEYVVERLALAAIEAAI
jgi:hypothetical protein